MPVPGPSSQPDLVTHHTPGGQTALPVHRLILAFILLTLRSWHHLKPLAVTAKFSLQLDKHLWMTSLHPPPLVPPAPAVPPEYPWRALLLYFSPVVWVALILPPILGLNTVTQL